MFWKSIFREFSARICKCAYIEQKRGGTREKKKKKNENERKKEGETKKGEAKEETRTREIRKEIRKKKKRKNAKLTYSAEQSEIQAFYRRWVLNIFGLRLRPGILFFSCNFRDTFV